MKYIKAEIWSAISNTSKVSVMTEEKFNFIEKELVITKLYEVQE